MKATSFETDKVCQKCGQYKQRDNDCRGCVQLAKQLKAQQPTGDEPLDPCTVCTLPEAAYPCDTCPNNAR